MRRRRQIIVILSLSAAVGLAVAVWWFLRTAQPSAHDQIILAAAHRYRVDPALVKAVVWRESQFDADARGKVGEIGLMQVGEAAAIEWSEAEHLSDFKHADLFDPKKNTMAGAWYLSKLLKRYPEADDPRPYALADYNAGRRNVLRWIKGPAATNSAAFMKEMDFPGTREYIQSVLKRHQEFASDFK